MFITVKFIKASVLKKIVGPIVAAVLFVSSLSSCALFNGDPNDRNVTYELSEDKKSVTFFATADSRAFSRWSVQIEDQTLLSSKSNSWEDDGLFRVTESRTLAGLKAGKTYVAFYIPSVKQEYTIIFGYNVSVDALGQISVEVAESDSMLGQESAE